MKSFKRYLKEETDPPEQGNASDYNYFRQFIILNLAGVLSEGGWSNIPYMFRNSTMTPVGNGAGRFGTQYPMFPMANAPQPLLDLFDYNGDGIIGYNDMSLAGKMFEILDEIFPQNGDGPPSGLPSASWYLENWESINQEYGVDLPDPSSWFFTYTYDGELFFQPDSQLPPNKGNPAYGLFTGENGGNGLYEWTGSVLDFLNVVYTMRGWRSVETGGIMNTEMIQSFFPEFYEWLMQMDYTNDGYTSFAFGAGLPGSIIRDFDVFRDAVEVISRYYYLIGVDSEYENYEYLLNRPFEEVNALQGYDGLNQFIQTLFLTGDKTEGLFNLPDGFQNTGLAYLVLLYGYGFDPNYGQVPTPPEETPIAQDPYQITQLPTPENP